MAAAIPGSSRSTGGFYARGGKAKAAKKRRKKRITTEQAVLQKRRGSPGHRHGVDFTSGKTPLQTPEQAADVARQKAERAKPKLGEVEVKRVGTREEVVALEDRPGVTPPELTPEVPLEPKGPGFFKEPSAVLPGRTRGETLGLAAAVGATVAVGGAALIATAGLSGAGTAAAATGTLATGTLSTWEVAGPGALISEASRRALLFGAKKAATTSATRLAAATGYISKTLLKTPVTTKGAKLILSYLGKLTAQLKRPTVVLAILGTGLYTSYFWAPNEKGDAMTTLTIAQKKALDLKDYEGVLEIGEQMRDADEIAATLPAIGFSQAEKAKFKASIKASEVYTQEAEKQMEATAEPPLTE